MDNKMMNKIARQVFSQQNMASQFQNTPTSNHTHNGIDSPRIPNLTLNADGFVKGGQTDYNTGIGFFVGYSGGAYKLSLGDPNGQGLTWDGATLSINGDIVIGQLSITAHPGDNLQTAINTLTASGGGTLYLTVGTFNVNYNIVMTSNTHIIGVGSGGSIIDFGGGAHQIQIIGTLGSEVVSVVLNGFTVQNSSTDLVRVDYGINFGTNDLTSKTGLTGIKITNTVTYNIYSSLQDACGTGMLVSDSSFATLFSSNQTNCTTGGGVSMTNVTNSTSIGCSVDACVGGGYIFINCSNFGFEDFSITNITGIGLDINGDGAAIGILDGFIDTCSSDGVKVHGNAGNLQIVAANTISNNSGYGVNISSGSNNVLVATNAFSSNTSGAINDLGTGTVIGLNVGV